MSDVDLKTKIKNFRPIEKSLKLEQKRHSLYIDSQENVISESEEMALENENDLGLMRKSEDKIFEQETHNLNVRLNFANFLQRREEKCITKFGPIFVTNIITIFVQFLPLWRSILQLLQENF